MSLKTNLLRELEKGPQTVKQLRAGAGADSKKITKALKAMEADGEVSHKKGLYTLLIPASAMVNGKLVKLGRTFGFVKPLDDSGDIFVPGHSLLGAMPGDVVRVALLANPRIPGSREGEIIEVTQPNNLVVGTVAEQDGRLVLVPDSAPDTPLQIRRSADGGVKAGEKAAAQILERGERHEDIRVGIAQRFGSAESAKQCAKTILFAAGVQKAFTEAVKSEAKTVGAAKITKEEIKARMDLRGEPIFTIDSESTKDIDDAISAYKTKDGYKLCVHIADVSWYVRPKTLLDEEALARGTSIYYADSVVPMLPRALSNGACSLNPGEDRLAFSCLMELDHNGRLADYQFVKSVIRSRVKGAYSEINALFAGADDAELREKYAEVAEGLPVMQELYRKLASLRDARGSMEIESSEPKLVLDEEGRCIGVEKRERGEAERMIEEFMLMANTAAAHLARRRGLPFVYRVHDKPSMEKVAQLRKVLDASGVEYQFKGEVPTQTELSALLDKTRGTNLEVPVHGAVLRSLAKALYEPLPKGHYGLALEDYAHFTSPIRRYPDLAIHRILSDYVAGTGPAALEKRYGGFAEMAAAKSSEREQLAVQIERDCDDSYKAEYMKQFVGQSFDAVVVSVTSFGLYVGLPNTVEGLVHITKLSDHRLELQDGVCLMDPVTGASFRVGDAMRVQLVGVDISQGNLDFVPDPA
ncbi:ribonuclease R [Ruminococcaceae bacterium OttesenSCG-928-A11]|nr:ribonuclease R [Ruminococcaceae bacterium OttesenSCG-928-A11]